jgi:hypothetical protein
MNRDEKEGGRRGLAFLFFTAASLLGGHHQEK